MMQLIEPNLISKLIQKDQQVFGDFYLQTVDIFYRFIKTNYILPEDDINQIISELYIKIRNHLSDYNVSYRFETRCWTIFRNLIKDWFKKTRERNFTDITLVDGIEFEETISSAEKDIVSALDEQFQYEHIMYALDKLDIEYGEVLYLRYVEEKTYEEIASICNLSCENVRQRISRGIKKIRAILSAQ
jgi:RNA polymerase sigma factor (sigma-70 family)